MIRTAIFTTLALAGSMTAVLPPFHQSVKEIQALIADSEFHELVGSAEAICGIVRTESGYEVSTRTRTFYVDVLYHSLGHPGPVPFTFDWKNSSKNHRDSKLGESFFSELSDHSFNEQSEQGRDLE